MAKREQARKDAAFARGEVGIDGASTEEQKDAAEVEADKAREQLVRGKTWLGREFLTWLLWRSEDGDPMLEVDGEDLVALFTGRLTLKGVHGDVTELSAKGTLAPYSEIVRYAIDRGLLVHQARVRFTHGERTWEATLDAEHLDVKSAKLPELLTEEEDDRQSERLDLADQLSGFVDALVEDFLALRQSRAWGQKVVPALKGWARGEGRKPGTTVRTAERATRGAA